MYKGICTSNEECANEVFDMGNICCLDCENRDVCKGKCCLIKDGYKCEFYEESNKKEND